MGAHRTRWDGGERVESVVLKDSVLNYESVSIQYFSNMFKSNRLEEVHITFIRLSGFMKDLKTFPKLIESQKM